MSENERWRAIYDRILKSSMLSLAIVFLTFQVANSNFNGLALMKWKSLISLIRRCQRGIRKLAFHSLKLVIIVINENDRALPKGKRRHRTQLIKSVHV